MSASAIASHFTWPPVGSRGNIGSTRNAEWPRTVPTGATGSNPATAGTVSGGADPFQQFAASLQALLVQAQSGAGTGSASSGTGAATPGSGDPDALQSAVNTLIHNLEQSLQNASGGSQATQTGSGQVGTAQTHHHHHHHAPDGNDGTAHASSGANMTQAIASYSKTGTTLSASG